LLKYVAYSIGGGDNASNQEAHIRSKGSADEEAAGGGTQGSGNPEAKGHRRKGGCHTQEEQEGLGQVLRSHEKCQTTAAATRLEAAGVGLCI